MTEQPEDKGRDTDRGPDFVLPKHDVVREDNWEEYSKRGFEPVFPRVNGAQLEFGVEHVYTGDAWDWEANRPLRHKPGIGVYVDVKGAEDTTKHGGKRDDDHPAAEGESPAAS